jgi:filamentous hemagglutinin
MQRVKPVKICRNTGPQVNGDMTNGVAPSSNTKGDDVKLSPGSSTGQTGMDMPKTPEHKQWNGMITTRCHPATLQRE